MGKEAKTNAMRILERAKVPYTAHEYAHEEGVAVDGVTVAASMGEDPACVYKTLVTQGSSKNYFVFVIPVAAELDLKAAARSVGEKSVAMIHVADINKVTGYVRGGCSPVGMKKQYTTVLMKACWLRKRSMSPAAALVRRCAAHPPTSSGQQGQQQRRSSSKLKRPYCQRNDGETVQSGACPSEIKLALLYSLKKSYLKRNTVSKLHKTFESFLTRENTREKLPQGPLQSGIFAVNCM